MTEPADQRRFRAYISGMDHHRAHPPLPAEDFVDAAVQFAERWAWAEAGVSVTVEDVESGERHCFHIDLETGRLNVSEALG